MAVERSRKSGAGGFANNRHMRRSTSSQANDSANDSNNRGRRPTRRSPSIPTRGVASRVGRQRTTLQSSECVASTSARGGGRSCGQISSSSIENDCAKASRRSLSFRGFMHVNSLRQNDQVHAAGACDIDFKARAAARSRATPGSAACASACIQALPAVERKASLSTFGSTYRVSAVRIDAQSDG